MKVYDWKTLLVTVIVGGGMLIYTLFNINDIFDIAWIAFWCYMIFQGIKISLTKDGFETEQKRIKDSKELRQKIVDKYGKAAYVLLYSPFAVLILGLGSSLILAAASPYVTLAVIIFVASVVLYVGLAALIRHFENKVKAE